MYSALRRSLLQCRIPSRNVLNTRLQPQFITRSFHASRSTWKKKDQDAPTTSISTSSDHDTSKPSSPSQFSTEPSIESTAPVDEAVATSEEDGQEVDLDGLAEYLTQTGDIDTALTKVGVDLATVSSEQKEELKALISQLKQTSNEDEKLDVLATEMARNPDDLQGAIARSGIDESDMGPLTKRERRFLREQGVDPDDEAAMEEHAMRAWGSEEHNLETDADDQVSRYLQDGEGAEPRLTFDPLGRNGFLDEKEVLPPLPEGREQEGFWNDDREENLGPDENFNQDDLPTAGHLELDLHREIREYARLMVWELPLLSKLARPFNPPTEKDVLRFRYTTYMGEDHPAEKKVVVSFSPSNATLKLTDIQRNKLIKLVGSRYNPDTDTIKMSCETFETPAQNKRYLGDLVEVLLKEAKDKKDTFEDIPFDFRYHTPKKRYEFPTEWILTPERKAALLEARKASSSLSAPSTQQSLPLPHSASTLTAPAHIPEPVYIDGLAHTRDGQLQRAREDRIRNMVLAERREAEDPRTRREKRTFLERKEADRAELEGSLVSVDKRARRPSRRPGVHMLPSERVLWEGGHRSSETVQK